MSTPCSIAPSPPRPAARWPWAIAWLLLTVYFVTPPREVADVSLDKSNYATYAHFFAQNAQWGKDVVPMTGPFGFLLYGHTYAGELFGTRLLGDFLLKAAFSALLLHLFRRAGPGPLRWVWAVAVVLLVPTVDDLFHDFAILVAALGLIANLAEDRPNRWSWLAAGLLGVLALFKGTHLLTTVACFGAVAVQGLLERRLHSVLTRAGLYAGSVVFWWCLARQNPLHLPAYIRDGVALSAGYNATMGLAEPAFIRTAGLLQAAGLAIVLGWAAAQARSSLRRSVGLLLLAGFAFIKWKHGFLRADGHVFIFFTAVAVLAFTVPLVAFTSVLDGAALLPSPLRRRVGLPLIAAVAGFAVLGSGEFWGWRVVAMVTDAPAALMHNLHFLLRPGVKKAELDTALEHNRREFQVPQIQNEIGDGAVDFFGFEEGLLLLNRLNYRPRPMGGGSFNVFTSSLQRRNEAFLRDPQRAPPWQVFKLQTLDGRLPAADDPLALRALLELYSPVLMQRDYLLLKRRSAPPPDAGELRHLETRSVLTDTPIALPDPGPGRLLLCTLQAPLSFAGRLRSFFYRPPELTGRFFAAQANVGISFALKPSLLHQPVIVSPLLLDNAEVLKQFTAAPGLEMRTLRLTAEPGFDRSRFVLTFFSAPRPRPPENGDIAELQTLRQHPLANRTPIERVSGETGIRELNKEPVTLIHAPGSITWELQPGDQQVLFSYGLIPQSYLGDPHTDGVEFNVEVLWPPADGRVVFQHMLRPATVAADRGMHRIRVPLPPYEPGAQLRIRTHPGPDNDGAFDQSYVTRMQIVSGPLIPAQFNGLGVVPADARLPHSAVAGLGARPVYLVHAPGEVTLAVPPGARTLACDIGLLPGAYTNGGNTDGVEFRFLARRPDGTNDPLLTCRLDPRQRPEDRGARAITVALPALPAGSQIVVATGPGPHGDRSWDQSWVADVSFR